MSKTNFNISAFVGIDWADAKHDFSIRSVNGEKISSGQIKHKPEELSVWINKLNEQFPGGKIAVCLEQSRGPLIYHLSSYDFIIIYPINPKSLARYREAFKPSGAKDDGPDADLLCEFVFAHRDRLKPWLPEDEQTRSIALLTEARRKAVDERTRNSNKLRSTLKNYFPQAIELSGPNLYDKMSLDFLNRWETIDAIQRSKDETIKKFYNSHNSRSIGRLEKRLKLIKKTIPLTKDKAVINCSVITVRMLVTLLSGLNEHIKEYDQQINELYNKHPDKDIFNSFHGAGEALAPRLLAAWGSNRDRYNSAQSMHQYSGVSPVMKRSGNSTIVQMRQACPRFIRQTFQEFSRCSIKKSLWAKAYYDMQRARGKSHNESIRSLSFKWIRIMYRCWRTRTCYDELTYLRALQKNHSPLVKFLSLEQKAA